jgi:predicted amino acid dehydrogenase
MPTHLSARPAQEANEERQVRKLAHSQHAPADWIAHAKVVVRSWEGQHVRQIAQTLGCHPQTVRDRLHAFNQRGLDGFGDAARLGAQATAHGAGTQRHPRLSESATAGQAHLRTDWGTGGASSRG